MTEAEWLTTTDPKPMRLWLWCNGSVRKLRLFECASCRVVWHELKDQRSREAVRIAELYADGMVSEQELDEASTSAGNVCFGLEDPICRSPYAAAAYNVALPEGWWGAAPAFNAPSMILLDALSENQAMRATQVTAIRDIFGNPFRPITLDPSWLTSTVLALANGIYSEKAFYRMPILADALQDAGCDNNDILNHCRQHGGHVRGCFVVDLLTGRA
jgi:hypothetical protein